MAHESLGQCVTDVLTRHIFTSSLIYLLNRRPAIWNPLVLRNKELKKLTVTAFTHLSSNVTETTEHPFDARIEEMKQNSQNLFGFYKTPKNLSKLNGKS